MEEQWIDARPAQFSQCQSVPFSMSALLCLAPLAHVGTGKKVARSWAIGNNPITDLISFQPPLTSISDSACNLDEAGASKALGGVSARVPGYLGR